MPDVIGAAVAEEVFTHGDAFAYSIWLNMAVPVAVPSLVAYTVATPPAVVALAKYVLTLGIPPRLLNAATSGTLLMMPGADMSYVQSYKNI